MTALTRLRSLASKAKAIPIDPEAQVIFERSPVEALIDAGRAELHWTCDEAGNWREELVVRRRAGNGWEVDPL